MADDFSRVMTALWSSLGLGGFTAGPGGTARLVVEGRRVSLRPTPDGAGVLVAVAVGRLSTDRVEADEQVRGLARRCAGLIVLRAAALRLASAEDVEAQAVAPCRLGAVPAITRAVEDALFVAEASEPLLNGRGSAGRGRAAIPVDAFDGALIFRP